MSARFGFIEHTRRIERELVQELELTASPLPPELARLEGRFREQPARLEARAYVGPAVRYCRAHRERDRGLMLLGRIFQPSVADRVLREVLFPERLPV